MNLINLEQLLSPVVAVNKMDSAALKLMLAQVNQAQLQLLPSGKVQLSIQTPQGNIPIQLPAAMLPAAKQRPEQVQVTIQPAPNNQLQLTIQHAPASAIKLALSDTQTQQLLFQLVKTQLSPSVMKMAVPAPATVSSLPASLFLQHQKVALQLDRFTPILLRQETASHIYKILQQNNVISANIPDSKTISVQITPHPKQAFWQLLIPRSENLNTAQNVTTSPASILLHPAEQKLLLKQIQQLLSTSLPDVNVRQNKIDLKGTPSAAITLPQPITNGQYQIQLQSQQNQWHLLLQPLTQSTQIRIPAQEIQGLLPQTAVKETEKTAAPLATSALPDKSQTKITLPAATKLPAETLPQAWRHLLPLLTESPSRLVSLPELPEPARELLNLIRQSQPDVAKPVNPQQLLQQLTALLQFNPVQQTPNLQTSAGTLAIAIQLLLGHLIKKPVTATASPNQRMSQLISQLDSNSAGQLLRQLAGHSSRIQQGQLATVENQFQNMPQQWLLQLPLQQDGQSLFSQLLIEQRDASQQKNDSAQTQWQLTMKFDLQQYGQLLVIAKLEQQDLQLQFYTDTVSTKLTTERFLPILKDRCKMQGIHLSQAACQLGKIPDSLATHSTSLVAVKV